jgi:16S rRNA (cytosine1402-N4)-methyltransferase
MEEIYHIPVLYRETIDNIVLNIDGVYMDCTLGGGGHSQGIVEALSDKGKLIAIDQDEQAIAFASKRLEKFGDKVKIFKNNFSNMDIVAYMAGIDKFDGIIMDIGVSSTQLDEAERGFSYRFDAPLDMRMDTQQKISAYNVVNEYSETQLLKIIYEYGEERFAKRIVKNIIDSRQIKPIETTLELVDLIKKATGYGGKKHPAKKTFQAIRIEVNRELEVLTEAIDKGLKLLKKGGRLGIITFHSLEDRIVKQKFKEIEKSCICPPQIPVCMCGKKSEAKVITKKPIIAAENELDDNNRAHSAKLRILERT